MFSVLLRQSVRPLILYTLITLALLGALLLKTGGHFAYVLDDAYIHLALAENLPAHMGINLSEATDSSSSILYTWLLVPFAKAPTGLYANFIINFLGGVLMVLGQVRLASQAGWINQSQPLRWKQAGYVLALLTAFNIFSLIFMGLEHVLHVAACLFILSGLISYIERQQLPRSFWVAFILAPLIRFEALALAGLVLGWFMLERRWRWVLWGGLAIAIPQILHASWLMSMGLPPLPTSLLFKSDTLAHPITHSGQLTLLAQLGADVLVNLHKEGGIFSLGLCGLLLVNCLWLRGRQRVLALVLALATLAHVLFGRFGWFERYHVYLYALNFNALLYFNYARLTASAAWRSVGLVCFFLCASAPLVFQLRIPQAGAEVWRQSWQLHEFLTAYWREPVMAVDIGAVSWGNPQEVIDILGLGSESIRRARSQGNGYYDFAGVARGKGIRLAIMFIPAGFDMKMPAGWTPVALFHLDSKPVVLPQDFTLVATSPQAVAPLMSALQNWQKTLPAGVQLGFNEAVLSAQPR